MPGNIATLETGQRSQPDVVKLREQKGVDEMAAVDREFWIINRLLGDLKARGSRSQESAASPPIELGFQFLRARHEIGEMNAKEIMTFDDVRIAFFDQRSEPLNRGVLGVRQLFRINNDQFFPTGVVRNGDACNVIAVAGIGDPGAGTIGAGYNNNLELHSFELFELQVLE